MGRCLVRLDENKYVSWSSVVDAPITHIMTLAELKEYLLHGSEEDETYIIDTEARIQRLLDKGTSSLEYRSAEEVYKWNRAGKHEECLTREQIIEQYTKLD